MCNWTRRRSVRDYSCNWTRRRSYVTFLQLDETTIDLFQEMTAQVSKPFRSVKWKRFVKCDANNVSIKTVSRLHSKWWLHYSPTIIVTSTISGGYSVISWPRFTTNIGVYKWHLWNNCVARNCTSPRLTPGGILVLFPRPPAQMTIVRRHLSGRFELLHLNVPYGPATLTSWASVRARARTRVCVCVFVCVCVCVSRAFIVPTWSRLPYRVTCR